MASPRFAGKLGDERRSAVESSRLSNFQNGVGEEADIEPNDHSDGSRDDKAGHLHASRHVFATQRAG